MMQANITLRTLDLSWNSVRMASGVALGQSLAHNSALTELMLAHNSLADAGGQGVRGGGGGTSTGEYCASSRVLR